MRISARMFFTAQSVCPAVGTSLKTQSSRIEHMFAFLLIEDSRYAEEGRKINILQPDGSEDNGGV